MYYVALFAIVLIFIWRIVTGFQKGMVREIISLVALVIGVVCAVLLLSAVDSYMDREIGQLIKFILIIIVVSLAHKLIHLFLSSIGLIAKLPVVKGVDKLLGAVVGFVEAMVIVGVTVYILKVWGLAQLM